MPRPDAGITYKLPREFMAVHGHIVEEWDWRRFPTLALKEILPGEILAGYPMLEHVRLHLAADGKEPVVRPLGGGSAIRLRRYNDTLPQFPKPTREELAAILAKKNPPKEDQQ